MVHGKAGTATVGRSETSGEDRTAELDRLFAPFARSDAPGLVVGVSSADGFGYRRGFGLASVQHCVANGPQTRMRIASITKQFTCVALMLLAEEGRVDIDAPAVTYLPALHEPIGRATLRHFMTHSSGIRCTLEMGTIANGLAPQPSDWQRRALERQASLQFEPGEEQLYCNGTYAALTDVIERCSEQSYADFLEQRVFAPLAMYDTEVVEDDTLLVPGMASAHVTAGAGWRRPPADSELRGDGGIVSTIDDLLGWLAHLRGPKKIGTGETWRQLLEPHRLSNGFETTYAMGFKRHSYRGVEVVQHSGGLLGLNAQVITAPAHGVDIAIVVNGAAASATRLAFAALDLMLAEKLAEPAPRRARTQHYEYLLGRRFALPAGLLFEFRDVDGALSLSQMRMPPAPVLYEDEASIFAPFEEIGFGPLVWRRDDLAGFERDPDRGLMVTIAGRPQRLEPLAPAADTSLLSAAAGTYRSDELDARAVIDAGGSVRLQGDYSAERRFRAEPLSDRHFELVSEDGTERYAAELDRAGATRGFWIDTHRARRIRFDRVG